MTNIALYSRHFHKQHLRGIGIYTHNLVAALNRLSVNSKFVLSDCFLRRKYLLNFPKYLGNNFSVYPWRIPGRLADYLFQRLPIVNTFFSTKKFDIVHFLHEYKIPKTSRNNTIMTVHSLGPVLYPQMYSKVYRLEWVSCINRGIQQSCKVIAVSKSLQKQLETQYSEYRYKFCSTQLGIEDHFLEKRISDLDKKELLSIGINYPYILYTGAADPNKNLIKALEGFHNFLDLAGDSSNHKLLIIGDKKWGGYGKFRINIKELGLDNRVVFTGYIAHNRLPLYYRNCDIFLFPSAFEGFGLPLLEAMASGATCLTSKRPSMDEVGGDSVAYCDPDSAESIGKNIFELMSDIGLRKQLSIAARIRAKKFSWDITAKKTLEIYEEVVGSKL
jgi:glycosyltransferase involved in cell wall biosynthesis